MDTTEGNQVGKIKPRHTIGWQKPISYLNAQRAKEMVSIDGLFSTFAAEGKHFILPKSLGIFHLFLHCLGTGQGHIFSSAF